MPDNIPDGLTREDVLQAMADIDSGVGHEFAESVKYDVKHGGKTYPPKAVIGLAAQRLTWIRVCLFRSDPTRRRGRG